MEQEESLTKKRVYELVISTLGENTLGYTYSKSNNRRYYFQREALRQDAVDTMKITVYFRKGYINCELRSTVYKHNDGILFSNGILNRRTFLFNSKSTSSLGPEIWSYFFSKNESSLLETLDLVLADLEKKGKEFVNSCDRRYSHPKFLKGLDFINNLTISKEQLKAIFPKHFVGYWWKLDNEKFIELELLFNEIDKDKSFEELKHYWENSAFAFEFFDKYISD
ncbi:hypothetical protein QNI16_21640 [Cytophagaceae bacterium YF14B1]|uniref:Uncharacterized protein n=1 Tax=Xanthocytophaga flava TaxID=3048013 RepID=A0AAE3QTT7_9BACT|nr:hypothetical protein [Xanthocytophaga flavus]MDJ1483116.1 hypothetical protein [Xanthocytophaga flavus]